MVIRLGMSVVGWAGGQVSNISFFNDNLSSFDQSTSNFAGG